MATTINLEQTTRLTTVPWYVWGAAAAVTSAMVGGHWDVSWHSAIGRDTFWTPAHIAIYLCGVLAGLSFGYLILTTTFSKSSPLRPSSVSIWGFRGPLGAFVAAWGGIAMLTSAPFDNWWHDAYGLDVKIVSPPHIVLFAGVYGVLTGTLILIAGHLNRSVKEGKTALRWLFLYCCGVMMVLGQFVLMEFTGRPMLHTSLPYILEAAIATICLAMVSRATGVKFAATFVAGFYMAFLMGLILVLPLFPAEPKLGPVYQQVTQFIPPQFPILLVVPALALDLFWQRSKTWNRWLVAAVSSFLFVGLLLAVEWPFASFLMSSGSHNAFFGTIYLPYGVPPTSYIARNMFYEAQPPVQFWSSIGLALLLGTLSVRFGISRGEWMRRVQR
jgi:hypothetical protein